MRSKFLSIILAAGLANSCVLMENPHGEGVDPTEVAVTASVELDVLLPGAEERPGDDGPGLSHRFVIEAVAGNGACHARHIIFSPMGQRKVEQRLTMNLHARDYDILVWSDYAPEGGDSPFHDASTLRPARALLHGGRPSEFKDCFHASVPLDLRPYSGQWNVTMPVRAVLQRPVGRFELIANDAELFHDAMTRGAITGREFTVRVSYKGFYAGSFNVGAGKASELVRHAFEAPLGAIPEQGELSLAFDYVFVDEAGEQVPLLIEIVNEKGVTQAATNVSVPMQRNFNTTLRGHFLTNLTGGGIVIDPSFDAEIDIDLGEL